MAEYAPYAIIGAGGIGGHFCRILHRMLQHQQLGENVTARSFDIYDFDVVEWKNTKWQDFEKEEIGNPKAVLMSLRWGFNSRVKRFGEEEVAFYQRYFIAADNPGVRRIIYEHAIAAKKPFVDMRSEGDVYAVFTDKCEPEDLLNSLGEDSESIEGRSCQRFVDQERNIVMLGNWFAATMGMDTVLRQFRRVPYPAQIVRAII
jgi:hypothetical protein